MSISIRCPHCNRELLLEEQYLDQEISCPGCAQGFLASSASASPAQLQYASPSGRQYYPRETCGKATAALVCGILGMTCLPMIFSILPLYLVF